MSSAAFSAREHGRRPGVAINTRACPLPSLAPNLRLWNTAEGSLRWHELCYSSPPPRLDASLASPRQKLAEAHLASSKANAPGADIVPVTDSADALQGVAVLFNGTVWHLRAIDGHKLWTWTMPLEHSNVQLSKLLLHKGSLFAVGSLSGQLVLCRIDVKTGTASVELVARPSGAIGLQWCSTPAITDGGIGCIEDGGRAAHVYSVEVAAFRTKTLPAAVAGGQEHAPPRNEQTRAWGILDDYIPLRPAARVCAIDSHHSSARFPIMCRIPGRVGDSGGTRLES